MLAKTGVDDVMTVGYSAPAGSTPMPTDMSEITSLDPTWRSVWEDFEEILEGEGSSKPSRGNGRQVRVGIAGVPAGYSSADR